MMLKETKAKKHLQSPPAEYNLEHRYQQVVSVCLGHDLVIALSFGFRHGCGDQGSSHQFLEPSHIYIHFQLRPD